MTPKKPPAPPPTPFPFLHRELAWLDFQERVLEEAEDVHVPLLERLKFLAIFSANLDEFFMVRVAALWRQVEAGIDTRGPDGRTPREVLDAISRRTHPLVRRQHRLFERQLLPELRTHGVRILTPARLDRAGKAFVSRWFEQHVHPVLTPLAIDPGHPFPYLANRTVAVIVELDPTHPHELPHARQVVLHLPAGRLPRFLRVPGEGHRYVLLEDVVRAHLDAVFSGYEVRSATALRVTRDAEFDAEEGRALDLMEHVEAAVRRRRLGAAVRLQVERDLPPTLLTLLKSELELDEADVYPMPSPIGLADLFELSSTIDLPVLRDPPHVSRPVPGLGASDDPFATIRRGDVLLHHPYDEFEAVTRFVAGAADDPAVIAIKMTLYRVSASSHIAQALVRAAQHGKEVAVLVELRARFSEEANIAWARKLEDAGAHVVYGIVGLKTHLKACLVVRREADGLRRYVHLGTGNYNHATARTYTDYGLLTADPAFGEDLNHTFNLLTGYVRPPPLTHLVLAPTDLRRWLLDAIAREAAAARAGRPSGIDAKLNALSHPDVVAALYAASRAGVPVRLIIRGPSCLRPQQPEFSENIRVVRLVDRFLEHARCARFGQDPDRWWLTSADWMRRNLESRVEAAWPIRDLALSARITAAFELQWADTVKGREIDAAGDDVRRAGKAVRAQTVLASTGG